MTIGNGGGSRTEFQSSEAEIVTVVSLKNIRRVIESSVCCSCIAMETLSTIRHISEILRHHKSFVSCGKCNDGNVLGR